MAPAIGLVGARAVVTGVSSGIGAGIAAVLSQAGADIAGCALDEAGSIGASSFRTRVAQNGRRAAYLSCDVAVAQQARSMVEWAAREPGGIDIVVSNAGRNVFRGAQACSDSDWNANIEFNLVAMVQSLALEWGPHIRTAGVAPGFVDTPLADAWFAEAPDPAALRAAVERKHPVGRLGTPDQIGSLVAFLCSPLAGFRLNRVNRRRPRRRYAGRRTMIEIAEFVPPTPTGLWTLVKQAGVDIAVGGLPTPADTGTGAPWDYEPLRRMKARYEEGGFRLAVIEARPPLNRAKRGLPGRDEEIDTVCALLENMGRLGVPVWCYEWMTDFNWMRTETARPSRGGSLVTSFDYAQLRDAPPTELGPIGEDELWQNLEYFLRRVVPVAERAGVKLAMHPDDPPLSPIRGVGRIMRSVENFQRLLDLVPSPANGITLCQGNFTLMTADLPSVIREFGRQGKIFFVHFRDVRGTPERFEETWLDAGQTDLLACMQAYRDIGFQGVLRPDHVPTVAGDSNADAGYSSFGRLFAIGYIRALQRAVYAASE